MLSVSEELKQKLWEANQELRKRYPPDFFNRAQLREKLKSIGHFSYVGKWKGEKLQKWLGKRTLLGVDGSVNSTPGTYPHTLSFFQALAKGTQGEEVWKASLYSPLLGNDQEGHLAQEAQHRGTLLARLEIETALEAIERWAPRVVMMDGSLFHFLIDDGKGWERLVKKAIEKQVLLVGVAEEIGTKSLARNLFEKKTYSDRELLFGTLQSGESYQSMVLNPPGSGLWKQILSSAKSPQPVGIDGLKEQEEEREALIALVHTLTPAQGRGIPLWLDIVDREVRVTDGLVKAMVDQYIDADLRHRLLYPKKTDRHL